MKIHGGLNALFFSALAIAPLAWFQKGRLPAAAEIREELRQSPIQREAAEDRFAFSYKGRPYNVQPLARYELWGLVVSHNHTTGLADIYHDGKSLDTKDVCVIWGTNVTTDDFHRVKFWNGPWTCNWRYPDGVTVRPSEVSNNHLITDQEILRTAIARLRVGDQIHLTGRLVAYQDAAQPEFWRNSSLTRYDTGNGACEVVFVQGVTVLKPGAPLWNLLWSVSFWLLILIPLFKFGLNLIGH
jgi:hypothetical protein